MAATAEDGERQREDRGRGGGFWVLFGFGSLFGGRQWRCGSVDRPADPFIRGCGRRGPPFRHFLGTAAISEITDGATAE